MGLLEQALAYLTVSVVMVPIASRLGLGSVLGYLVGGCIVGPFVIGVVEKPDDVLHFAEFGVVLMLFMIGLELDLQRLWNMRRAVFGGGMLQFGITAVVLAAALLPFGDISTPAAIVAGLAMALSSTAIAVQTMAEKHLTKTPVGQTAFSILLFQDIAAIPIIAIVPLLGVATGESSDGLGVLKAVGAIVGVIGIGRYLTTPILRLIAKTGLREIFTAFALFLVVAISALMTAAGLSMALGAFLAGVLLASSEYRHALETDLEPFKGLLMGLFFISVGMTIDFALFAQMPLMVLGLTLGLLIIKILVLRAIAPRLGVAGPQRWLFAALISQGGEFAFVVFGVANTAKVLAAPWDGLLTLAVALSMAMTPLLMVLHERFMQPPQPAKPDEDVEDEGSPVIIAGFGRVGQIIGRFLFASGIKATVLDHDPDQIELLKRFGFKIFYGDATRLDLLHAAGAHHARVLVVAIDDVESSVSLVEKVRHHFPKLRIIARARNVGHYTRLRKLGVELVERETFESSVKLGREALVALGCPPFEARERADRFRRNNVGMLESLLPIWEDEAQRRQLAIQSRKELEEQFELERQALTSRGINGWHYEHEHGETELPQKG